MASLYRDRYEPIALAGRGAQGEVWKAHDQVHDRTVALKIRDAKGADRETLLSEARTLLAMRPHQALPLVRDDFFAEDRYVMVMDWIEGRSLATVRDASFADTLGWLADVALALDHLHAHDPPIVHRDVKPQNVILTPDGRTVLVDFGLAGSTQASYFDGTPGFIAPEVASGIQATPASDVFSLAVTAYVSITGTYPAPGQQPDLSAVPEGARDRVARALLEGLAIDPRHRPVSATELISSMRVSAPPSNLPAALSSFVGRSAETVEIRRLLSSSRLVTLVGVGGSGKTRLAVHVADTASPSFPGGVWLAELAGVTEPDLLASRVAASLGLRTDAARDASDALVAFLSSGTQLLVLDNCEHLIDACAHLAEALLRACPGLTILATSREALRIPGEAVWMVGPLDDDDSVALFRARAGTTKLAADDPRLRNVCSRLDGIPLALELAAAQLRTTPLDQLVAGLDQALGVLTGGARTNPRQETMQATIDWSHELLSADEQAALRRLSVFAGGFTREAADAVAHAASPLVRLVDTSLVQAEGERLRLLEPVRQFAAARLDDAGESDDYRGAHARWILELTEREESITYDWVQRLSTDHDNIEAAISYTMAAESATAGEIVRRAVLYWTHSGHWVQGRHWVDRALESDALDQPTRAELLNRAGDMARNQGDLAEGRRLLEQSVALYRELGDRRGLGLALLGLGLAAHALGDIDASKAHQLESVDINRELGNTKALAMALNNLAVVHDSLGHYAEAISVLEQALEIQRAENFGLSSAFVVLNLGGLSHKTGDLVTARTRLEEALEMLRAAEHAYGCAAALNDLASIDLAEGDIASARTRAEESLEISCRQNDRSSEAYALHVLASVARREGDLEGAAALHANAVDLRRAIGAPLQTAASLDQAAVLDVQRGDAAEATRRFGEAVGLREASGVPTEGDEEVLAAIAAAREMLGDDAFEHEWAAGRRAANSRSS
jgi:predicted ATPase/tRNA A-37 threonylcarbamoyl transferase component Bud32